MPWFFLVDYVRKNVVKPSNLFQINCLVSPHFCAHFPPKNLIANPAEDQKIHIFSDFFWPYFGAGDQWWRLLWRCHPGYRPMPFQLSPNAIMAMSDMSIWPYLISHWTVADIWYGHIDISDMAMANMSSPYHLLFVVNILYIVRRNFEDNIIIYSHYNYYIYFNKYFMWISFFRWSRSLMTRSDLPLGLIYLILVHFI